ncbi:hypothetical protein AAHA92_22075 [Salvia divinorum]|uniref:Uncharacterized protein n=1 Tax=Salvia divinorum TaxID=28513 RepID=A0ABD1GMH4_SALDI
MSPGSVAVIAHPFVGIASSAWATALQPPVASIARVLPPLLSAIRSSRRRCQLSAASCSAAAIRRTACSQPSLHCLLAAASPSKDRQPRPPQDECKLMGGIGIGSIPLACERIGLVQFCSSTLTSLLCLREFVKQADTVTAKILIRLISRKELDRTDCGWILPGMKILDVPFYFREQIVNCVGDVFSFCRFIECVYGDGNV